MRGKYDCYKMPFLVSIFIQEVMSNLREHQKDYYLDNAKANIVFCVQ